MLLDQFDLPILKFLTGFAGRSDFVDRFAFALSDYDTFKGVVMMSLLWLAWFYREPGETPAQQDQRQIHLLIVFVGSVATVILSRILQLSLHFHKRPLLDGLDLKFPTVVDPATINPWNSFPSDHMMLFCALATGLWQVNRRIGGFAFFWTIIVIALPRIYLGVHYPSDIVAGILLGVLCMLGFERLPLQNGGARLLAWSKIHPALFFCGAFLATEQVAHLFDDVRDFCRTMIGHFSAVL
jgi:undecaprenyl-diphosphatase